MSAEPKNAYNAHVVGGVDNSEHEGPAGSDPIFKTPLWVTVVRGFQAFFGFIILILSGLVIHGLALDASVFALVCGLFTLIIVGYTLLSEKAVGCHKAYNYWAHMSLDLLMAIFWLSSMGANAALRASFTVSVNADCWSDGSAVNSGHCNIYRRTLEKRVAVATKLGLSCMAATAGLSALQMLLFIATLAYLAHQVRLHLQANKKSGAADNGQVEMNAQQSQPMLNQQYQPHQNTEYPSQVYPQQAQQPQAPYDPHSYDQTQQQQQPQQYQQQPQQPPQQYQQQYQQYPEMAGTPAPEQQYQQQYPQSTATPAPEQQYQYGYPQQQQQQQHQYAPAYASPTATPAPQQPYHPPQ